MPARSLVVSGHVQGVGFRMFVRRTAESLGITGEVWNRLDGNVEAVFEHSDEGILAEFERRLHSGPGTIDRIEVNPVAVPLMLTDFRIGPTRP